MKEDKASWVSFFQWLRGRGLEGVKLIVGDKCLGMLEAVGEVFPEAKYQRCGEGRLHQRRSRDPGMRPNRWLLSGKRRPARRQRRIHVHRYHRSCGICEEVQREVAAQPGQG